MRDSRIRDLSISATTSLIFAISQIGGKKKPNEVRILAYHSIENKRATHLGRRVASFEDQLASIKTQGFNTISLHDYYRHRLNAEDLPPKSVVLTFDDGYLDFYSDAFPILQAYNLTATVFLIAGLVGARFEGRRILTWTQVREMRKFGVDFGAHTLSHASLPDLVLDAARHEISASKTVIEQALGAQCDFFCYPWGRYNDSVKQIVRQSGFLGACSFEKGANNDASDPYALTRTDAIVGESLWEFRKRINGAYDTLHNCLSLRHRR